MFTLRSIASPSPALLCMTEGLSPTDWASQVSPSAGFRLGVAGRSHWQKQQEEVRVFLPPFWPGCTPSVPLTPAGQDPGGSTFHSVTPVPGLNYTTVLFIPTAQNLHSLSSMSPPLVYLSSFSGLFLCTRRERLHFAILDTTSMFCRVVSLLYSV